MTEMKQTKEPVAWIDMLKPDQERILLIPYSLSDVQEDRCHHHEPIKGIVGFSVCNNWAGEYCACCGKPTCKQHFSERHITLEHARHGETYILCLECSKLPRVHIEAIFKLRIALNKA